MQPATNKHTVKTSNSQGSPLQRKYVCMVNHKPSVHLGEQSVAGLLLSCENIAIGKYTMTEEELFYPESFGELNVLETNLALGWNITYVSKMRRSYASGIFTSLYRNP